MKKTEKKVQHVRLEVSKREKIDGMATKEKSDFSKISRDLYDLYLDNYDHLFQQASELGITVIKYINMLLIKFRKENKI